VVAGAAAGLVLAVAACIAGDDPAIAESLPVAGGYRVVAQTALHNAYDRLVRLTGVEVTTVGYASRAGMGQTLPWQLDAALRQPAVAVLHTITSDTGALPIETVVEVAHEHAVPVVVDAAAELPPVTNLSRFLLAGADVVVFSGGKAIRGPQASGLLLGRADLVRSVRAQQDDTDADRELTLARTGRVLWQQGIGRAMKVSCETMLALELIASRGEV
jgi:L-seryl-tRNA(Ser) seleniumtransferase